MFTRNLATSSKASLEQQKGKKPTKPEETKRAPFVKINMDGIPIGTLAKIRSECSRQL
jgi:auxin-responsive protein IAA